MNLLLKGNVVNNYEAVIRKQNIILSLATLLVVAGLFYQGISFLQQNLQSISWEK